LISGLDKNCYKQRGWGKIGQKLIGKISGKHIKRTNIVAGLWNKEIVVPLIFQGSCNTELFVRWIAEQLVPSLKVGQTVVMDNASIHKSPCVRKLIEEAGCRLIYLPPYSPDLNPIETFWANMKQWIKCNMTHITNT
jgi:transposase